MKNIRNFCIIAHIDHGKSTLADRMLEITGTVEKRNMKEQLLDGMDLERERGITIKLQPVRMDWKGHILNLIDTPGHVDFSFEVSRSLAAVEGAILVVDATQGIEAQTLANLYSALEHNLEIIAVLNKIDLPAADPERVKTEIENAIGIPKEEMIEISAKSGMNVDVLLDEIVSRFPSPKKTILGDLEGHQNTKEGSKALVFDSVFDPYRGVVAYVRVFSGTLQKRAKARFLGTKTDIEILECGYFRPQFSPQNAIESGEIGYVVTGLKSTRQARVGDTLFVGGKIESATPLPGFRIVRPMLYAGIFPTDADSFFQLREALEKLSLSDSALVFEPEHSPALGNGFRIGFLGMLHLEIIQERLEREFDLDLIVTAPSVPYDVTLNNGEILRISSAADLPDPTHIQEIQEPWTKAEIITPKEFVGGCMDLCSKRRGIFKNMQYLDETRTVLTFEMPLSAVITDMHDRLKSLSSGYASLSSDFLEYRVGDLVKLDILIAEERVESLSQMVHRSEARYVGSPIVLKLKEVIPRANFPIALQAAIGGKIIARETIPAYRKDVTAGLYGGDVTRKNKLLKKQKAGKKRMKSIGKVDLPQEAFLAVLKRED
ncbi:elongation factor 4 [Candidatus Peregrinibacteria bacterium]|nr:MAG: elongation factor 4 [Candidatus Peregrinibacteria bacterium]